jgi:hypothetical protein
VTGLMVNVSSKSEARPRSQTVRLKSGVSPIGGSSSNFWSFGSYKSVSVFLVCKSRKWWALCQFALKVCWK